jgi:uncharacterized membrane protein
MPEHAVPAEESIKLAEGRHFPQLEIAAWIAFAVYLVLVVCFAWNPTPLAQCLAAIGIAGACAHAVLFYGWRDAAVLVAICLVTTFTMENVGVATGMPFGHYHFEVGSDLMHVGAIPMIVGPLWFGMGYFSWIIAGILLGGTAPHLSGTFETLARPVVAAFVMAQWDVVMDPPEATISKAWIWHDGGGHFGVPLSNYLGWLLTAWLFHQAFAIYLGRRNMVAPAIERRRTFGLVAILFYLSSGLTHVTAWVVGQSGEVTDAAGHIWRSQDVREATVVVMLFTMFFTSMLAALSLAADHLRAGRQNDEKLFN